MSHFWCDTGQLLKSSRLTARHASAKASWCHLNGTVDLILSDLFCPCIFMTSGPRDLINSQLPVLWKQEQSLCHLLFGLTQHSSLALLSLGYSFVSNETAHSCKNTVPSLCNTVQHSIVSCDMAEMYWGTVGELRVPSYARDCLWTVHQVKDFRRAAIKSLCPVWVSSWFSLFFPTALSRPPGQPIPSSAAERWGRPLQAGRYISAPLKAQSVAFVIKQKSVAHCSLEWFKSRDMLLCKSIIKKKMYIKLIINLLRRSRHAQHQHMKTKEQWLQCFCPC